VDNFVAINLNRTGINDEILLTVKTISRGRNANENLEHERKISRPVKELR
jgi:hypothetical protein